MNAYKFNSHAQFYLRKAIAESLNLKLDEVYQVIKKVHRDNTFETHSGKFFKLELTEIENGRNNSGT